MLEQEIVEKRKWITQEKFLDLMGATNLIPGPNSTEMTMHCGHERAGVAGLFVAGICFIFPAVVITGIFAWIYKSYGSLPEVEAFIFGIKPAVLIVILLAIIKLGKKALKNVELGMLGVLVLLAAMFGVNEIVALLSGGILGTLYFVLKSKSQGKLYSISPIILLQIGASVVPSLSSLKIFLTFAKVGAILYGSGYVLFAYLDAELVQQAIMTRVQLIDAIAVGQFTPGPVLSTSTFIGYQLGGWQGAIAATVGIFLPSFFFVWMLNPLVDKMRKSKVLGYFLDCVNVAAVAIMCAVLLLMGKECLTDWRAIAIAVLAGIVAFLFKKISAVWIVLGGAIMGYILLLF